MCASELLVFGYVSGFSLLCIAGPMALAQNNTPEPVDILESGVQAKILHREEW
jgi:hypothetical protein